MLKPVEHLSLLDKAIKAIESSFDDIFKVSHMDMDAGLKLARKILDDGLMNFYNHLILVGDSHDAGYFNGRKIGDDDNQPSGYYFRWIDNIGIKISAIFTTPFFQNQYLENDRDEVKRKVIELILSTGTSSTCSCCGRKYSLVPNIDHMELRIANEKNNNCEFQDGFKDEVVEISCPSGKFVFANDFRKISPYSRDKYSNYTIEKSGRLRNLNSGIGSVLMFRYQAELGIAYISTGNTCPKVFFDKANDQIQIRTGSGKENESNMGSICTDLWAVQAMDYTLFQKMCSEKNFEPSDMMASLDAFIVNVTPGIYKVIEHCEYPYTKGNKEISLFATFSLK